MRKQFDVLTRKLSDTASAVSEGCIEQLLSQGADISKVQKVCVGGNEYVIVDTESRIGFKLGITWTESGALFHAEPYYWRDMPECLRHG